MVIPYVFKTAYVPFNTHRHTADAIDLLQYIRQGTASAKNWRLTDEYRPEVSLGCEFYSQRLVIGILHLQLLALFAVHVQPPRLDKVFVKPHRDISLQGCIYLQDDHVFSAKYTNSDDEFD
jgi:hypothetical protein